MPQGAIKKLTDKGFGFIDGEGGDVFFHMSALQGANFDDLHEGQLVEYEEEESQKGPRATSVKPVA
jgi:CspA family cold shock protein